MSGEILSHSMRRSHGKAPRAVLAPPSIHRSHTLSTANIATFVLFCLLLVISLFKTAKWPRADVVSNVLSSGGCGVPHGDVMLEKPHSGPLATSSVNAKHSVFRQTSGDIVTDC